MKVYLTNKALTKGIVEKEGNIEPNYPTMFIYKVKGYAVPVHKPYWYETKKQALEHAEKLRVNKIASLNKQIAKLEKLKFKGTCKSCDGHGRFQYVNEKAGLSSEVITCRNCNGTGNLIT